MATAIRRSSILRTEVLMETVVFSLVAVSQYLRSLLGDPVKDRQVYENAAIERFDRHLKPGAAGNPLWAWRKACAH